ncbi:hypothetical protein, unknown function [Leishmania mexicana MHOM/GT/2001/U1103]|uniref:Ch28 protein n=1 Tax=Leishmania mexicana (strain MHOM/GT/2001/U1103) TaxID=929439 RepID=E9AZI0_LEIMU|nr:hypothetical protein, unknown function [Leishmania mexicana MHOM/GT/2001/U1103]CBZ28380.1 hypothetical protein, unknown function [Leishmania mexicana MHOM/GT/2001/U1103]
MLVIDEEDRQGRMLYDGLSSPEEEHPVPQLMCNDECRKSSYQRQVQRWQQEETSYLKHEGWCEHRLILLMQEAFRSSRENLKHAFSAGAISVEAYATRLTGLKNALLQIKKEYRRTLQRTRDRKGDLPSIASKAVTCIASVYPWSSSGFVMGFEENVRFGQLAGVMGSGTRRGTPVAPPTSQQSTNVGLAPCRDVAPISKVVNPGMSSEHLNAAAPPGNDMASCYQGRRLVTPHVTLRPLPPRRQLFRKGMAPEGSLLLSAAHTGTSADGVAFTMGPPLVESLNRSFFGVSPNCLSPHSPVLVPPASVTGPFRDDERRFLEKRQLVVQGMSFVSYSLASSTFISSRRATIASVTMKKRLHLAKGQAPPPTSIPASCATVMDTPIYLPPPASFATSNSFPKTNRAKHDGGGVGTSTVGLNRRISEVMPWSLPFLAPGNDSFHIDLYPNAPVARSPPPYEQAVAVSSEYRPGNLVRLPSCYHPQVPGDRMCYNHMSLRSLFSEMPSVSMEEEKYVKALW